VFSSELEIMGADPQKKVQGTPPFPPVPLEVGPSNPAGVWECCKLPQWPKLNLMHFSLKIWHLVATILIISREITD